MQSRTRRYMVATIAALAPCAAAPPAPGAAQPVSSLSIRWDLGERLGQRLSGRCINTVSVAQGIPGGLDGHAFVASTDGAAVSGQVDFAARRGRAWVARGPALEFRPLQGASAPGTRTVKVGRPGLEFRGARAYLTRAKGAGRERIAAIAGLKVVNRRLTRGGAPVPDSLVVGVTGSLRALKPLAPLGRARCRGPVQAGKPTGVRAGRPVGRVRIALVPSRGIAESGTLELELALRSATSASSVQPLAGATAVADGVRLPVTGTFGLVCGSLAECLPAGPVATTSGIALSLDGRTVELRDIAVDSTAGFRSAGDPSVLEGGVTAAGAVIGGGRVPVVVAGPGGRPALAPELGAAFGVPELELDSFGAKPAPGSTRAG